MSKLIFSCMTAFVIGVVAAPDPLMTDSFDFQPYNYSAQVVSVYDGDTITAEIDLGFKIKTEQKLRLYGINTPELTKDERPEGLKARDYLRGRILHKRIFIKTVKDKTGKYGRYIVVIYLQEGDGYTNINRELVEYGYAILADY